MQKCETCRGPMEGQNIFDGSHRHKDDCIAYLKRAVDSLTERAAFGDQCFQDRCENAYVEQSVRDAELAALRAEIERLREALRKYGHHEWNCPKSHYTKAIVCLCGLDKALAGGGDGI